MKTLIAKFPGTCIECHHPIKRGQQIDFFGRGRAAHTACRPGYAAGDPNEDSTDEDLAAGLEPGTLANDRRLARRGLSVCRLSSGAVITQNARGRCEDAPCCGCCT